jgi:hypothetical protein
MDKEGEEKGTNRGNNRKMNLKTALRNGRGLECVELENIYKGIHKRMVRF